VGLCPHLVSFETRCSASSSLRCRSSPDCPNKIGRYSKMDGIYSGLYKIYSMLAPSIPLLVLLYTVPRETLSNQVLKHYILACWGNFHGTHFPDSHKSGSERAPSRPTPRLVLPCNFGYAALSESALNMMSIFAERSAYCRSCYCMECQSKSVCYLLTSIGKHIDSRLIFDGDKHSVC
jgi:hypothetical protein